MRSNIAVPLVFALVSAIATACSSTPEPDKDDADARATQDGLIIEFPANSSIRTHLAGARCIDVIGRNTANGTRVELYDCTGGANQNWTLMADGTVRGIGGKCLDASGVQVNPATAPNGTPVGIWDCNGGGNQKWTYTVFGEIRLAGTNKCLEAPTQSGASGSLLEVSDCWGGPNQLWAQAGSVGGSCRNGATLGSCDVGLGCDATANVCVSGCGAAGAACCDGPETNFAGPNGSALTSPWYCATATSTCVLRRHNCDTGPCDTSTRRCGSCGTSAGIPCCAPDTAALSAVATCYGDHLGCKFAAGTQASGTCIICGNEGHPACGNGTCDDGLVPNKSNTCVKCGDGGEPTCGVNGGYCNAGSMTDGLGACVTCSTLSANTHIQISSEQPWSPTWKITVAYSLPLPPDASIGAYVMATDTTTHFSVKQYVTTPSGTVTLHAPLSTSGTTFTVTMGDDYDSGCAFANATWTGPVVYSDVATSSLCGAPNFKNYGSGSRPGPVTIVPLLWGFRDDAFAKNLDVVYTQLETSNYYAWLRREYNAPELHHSAPVVVFGVPLGSSIRDSLDTMTSNGSIPNVGTLVYVVHLSPGTVVAAKGVGTICVSGGTWAYNTMNSGSNEFYYVVMPDPRTSCYGQTLGQNNFTAILTHEVAENLTDPKASNGPGWEDLACTGNGPQSQIGDLCTPGLPLTSSSVLAAAIQTPYFNPATGNSYLVVQKQWSNLLHACVTEDGPRLPYN